MENKAANFQLVNVILVESSFHREKEMPLHLQKDFKNDLAIDIIHSLNEPDILEVELKIQLISSLEEKVYINFTVSNVGIFKYDKATHKDLIDKFILINAPAIIFPFTREIVANLSVKGGLNPILLQPVNFVELSKKAEFKS